MSHVASPRLSDNPSAIQSPHWNRPEMVARWLFLDRYEAAAYYVYAGACAMEGRCPSEYTEWHTHMAANAAQTIQPPYAQILDALHAAQRSAGNHAASLLFRKAAESVADVQAASKVVREADNDDVQNSVSYYVFTTKTESVDQQFVPVVAAVYLNNACVACSLLGIEGHPSPEAMLVTARVIAFENTRGELNVGQRSVPNDWSIEAIRKYIANGHRYKAIDEAHPAPIGPIPTVGMGS